VLPRLSELFARYGFPSPVLPIATATNSLSMLDKRILEIYLEQKSDPLVGTIEPSMYLGRYDWDTIHKPTDIKPYAKEIIANMIGVHAEVRSD
jgi:exocyst complex component 2